MTERITSQAASDVAGIAIGMPLQPTSADMLAALHKAWKAGYSDGFGVGVIAGQKQICEIHELLHEAMS